jgi:sec-independent protein translocase protein TatA
LFGIGGQELLVLFLVVLLLFGADRIPEVARALGKSIRDFKRAAGEIETEIQQVTKHKDLLSGGKQSKPGRGGAPSSPRPLDGAGEKTSGDDDASTEGDRPGGDDDDAPEAGYAGKEAPGESHRPG